MLRRLKGQSTLEYAMTIAVVVAGLISMQIYMKRSIEGRLRGSADDMGEQVEVEEAKVTSNRKRKVKIIEETKAGVTTSYTGYKGKGSAEVITVKGKEEISAW